MLEYLQCKVVGTADQKDNEEAWLALRSKGIGGSDIGSICGVSKFSSPTMVYLKKTGQYSDVLESMNDSAAHERMHFGHVLESVVAEEFEARTGVKCAVLDATVCHPDNTWALANVDRVMLDAEGKPYGILECKTASEYLKDLWETGELPISYLYQLQWYLYVTGLKVGAMACLVGGNKFFHYEVTRDDVLINDVLIPAADKFWNYNVKELVAPEIDGSEATTEFLVKMYGADKVTEALYIEDEAEADEIDTAIIMLREEKKRLKEVEAEVTKYENIIKAKMGTATLLQTGMNAVKWGVQQRKGFDYKRLLTEHPEFEERYTTISKYRVFKVGK